MKINYNPIKDELLKTKRNVSFEDVINAIEKWDVRFAPNPKSWRENQWLIIFKHNDYPHVCPYVIEEWWIFLKTIYPDRDYKDFI
jgi:hypothetical protein